MTADEPPVEPGAVPGAPPAEAGGNGYATAPTERIDLHILYGLENDEVLGPRLRDCVIPSHLTKGMVFETRSVGRGSNARVHLFAWLPPNHAFLDTLRTWLTANTALSFPAFPDDAPILSDNAPVVYTALPLSPADTWTLLLAAVSASARNFLTNKMRTEYCAADWTTTANLLQPLTLSQIWYVERTQTRDHMMRFRELEWAFRWPPSLRNETQLIPKIAARLWLQRTNQGAVRSEADISSTTSGANSVKCYRLDLVGRDMRVAALIAHGILSTSMDTWRRKQLLDSM
jgi:hypothetical protein